MNGFKVSAIGFATAALFALNAVAQGTTTADPKKTPKAEETKDQKKAPPTAPKATVKKAQPKKAEAKKVDAKKADAKKAPAKGDKAQVTSQGGTVQKYQAGQAPDLKDAKGNTVQTSPDAYDISSATKPAPKKK